MFSVRLVPKLYQQNQLPVLSTWLARNTSSKARVRIKQGQLQGTLENLPSGGSYASFKGIPYAKPPVGDLRFAAPLSPDPWEGIKYATEHGTVCPQFDSATQELHEGSEDCLFLNVYTPGIEAPPKPVMIFLYGGAFTSGSGNSDMYGPEFLVDEGVILVTINYRLEALGFLSLGTKEVPGNAGMKDQVLALRWVKENISQFGGDSNNITVFGGSAGGASATYHMISPMSKGLINKVIAQSGTFFNEWAVSSEGKDRAFRLGKLLGKQTNDTEELLQHLRSVPAKELVKVTVPTLTSHEKFRGLPRQFVPIIEKQFDDTECFLPKPPRQLFHDHCERIPLLIGYNSLEGLFLVSNNIKKRELFNKTFERKVPWSIVRHVTPQKLKEIAEKIRKYYYGSEGITENSIVEITNLESDYNFNFDILNFAIAIDQLSEHPVYFYKFSMDGDLNLMKSMMGYEKVAGASHSDDLFYIFKSGMDISVGSNEWLTVKRMVRMWANFAKYGNPTPEDDELLPVKWEPLNGRERNYLEIDSKLKTGQYPDRERHEFWRNLYEDIFGNIHAKSHL